MSVRDDLRTMETSQFSPVHIKCYGCGAWVTVMQHVATTAVTCAACEDCRKRWDVAEADRKQA